MAFVIATDLREQTRRVLATLDESEQWVLRMRFGIGEQVAHSVAEVGRRLAVPEDEIRRIEAEALRKLRSPIGKNGYEHGPEH